MLHEIYYEVVLVNEPITAYIKNGGYEKLKEDDVYDSMGLWMIDLVLKAKNKVVGCDGFVSFVTLMVNTFLSFFCNILL